MSGGERTRRVVLLSKQGCHLCEAAESEIRSLGATGLRLEVVDIDGDQELHDRYWLRVPVVMVDGEEVFEARMMDLAGEWKQTLAEILGQGRQEAGPEDGAGSRSPTNIR